MTDISNIGPTNRITQSKVMPMIENLVFLMISENFETLSLWTASFKSVVKDIRGCVRFLGNVSVNKFYLVNFFIF